jgi:hypothetical protein
VDKRVFFARNAVNSITVEERNRGENPRDDLPDPQLIPTFKKFVQMWLGSWIFAEGSSRHRVFQDDQQTIHRSLGIDGFGEA